MCMDTLISMTAWLAKLSIFVSYCASMYYSYRYTQLVFLVQVVPADAFVDPCWSPGYGDIHRGLHQLALEVYSRCRTTSNQTFISKSLTNFGMSTARHMNLKAMVSWSMFCVILHFESTSLATFTVLLFATTQAVITSIPYFATATTVS